MQFGHSKDDPTRPQIKVMMGSLDTLGMPLATDVLSGERADDGLYIPLIERIEAGLNRSALLFVGDCKMSALATRAHVTGRQHFYLSPLPLTGATAEAMAEWISAGIAKDKDGALERIFRVNHGGEGVLVAEGYEFERPCCLAAGAAEWNERVLVVRSPVHAERQAVGLEKRLAQAEHKLAALTQREGGANVRSTMKRRSWRPLTTCSRNSGWRGCSPLNGSSNSSGTPNTSAGDAARRSVHSA